VRLTRQLLADATRALARKDRDLARIHRTDGVPPLWARQPGFVTLIRIILEQQVSLASARAIYRRLAADLVPLTPERVLAAGASSLRSIGLTRQKAGYFINVAAAIQDGELDLRTVGRSDDDAAMQTLTRIKGVGPWTAECYLLMALRRPDVWPAGDIALAGAVRSVKGLGERPSPQELVEIAEPWRPHRAAAARMLWQHYLKGLP